MRGTQSVIDLKEFRMKTKTCLITGANSGIGKEAAILLAKDNYNVIIACRNPEKAKVALSEIKERSVNDSVILKIVDMSSQKSIKNLSTDLHKEYKCIDAVIHNAAIFDISQKNAVMTEEGIESIWATNHIGPVLFNQLNMDLLKKSDDGRIITISSKGLLAMPGLKISFDDPEFKYRKFSVSKAYYQSKLAQVMYTQWLANKMKGTNVKVNSIRVPAVQVDIAKYANLPNFMKKIYAIKSKNSITPSKMAETYKHLLTSDDVKDLSGLYFNEKNQVIPFTKYQEDSDSINSLMNLTKKYIL